MRKRFWTLLIVMAVVAAACGGGETGNDTSTGVDTTGTESGAASDPGGQSSQPTSADTPAEGYQLTSSGDLAFEHTGDNLCSIYGGRLEIDFLQFDDVFVSYSGVVDGFAGAGEYQGSFTVINDAPVFGAESTGPLTISAQIGDLGGVSPILFGEVSGSFKGDAGSGAFEGAYACQVLETELYPETADSGGSSNRMEYTVTGDASASIAETDVAFCGRGTDNLLHAIGAWTISVEAPAPAPGTLTASFTVTAPSQVEEVSTGDLFADQFKGEGSLTYEDSDGLFSGSFSAPGLRSDSGFTIDLDGTFSCVAF